MRFTWPLWRLVSPLNRTLCPVESARKGRLRSDIEYVCGRAYVQHRGYRSEGTIRNYWGIEVTASKKDSVFQLDEATLAYARMRRNPMDITGKLVKDDRTCIMAHVCHGFWQLLLSKEPFHLRDLSDTLTIVEHLLDRGIGTPREQAYVAALQAAAQGQLRDCLAFLEHTLLDHPRDFLGLRICHDLYFRIGDAQAMRDSIARVRESWNSDALGYFNVEAMYSLALSECGETDKAEKHGEIAASNDPEDGWAVHAVAETLERQGRHSEGASFLKEIQDVWEECDLVRTHLYFHWALFGMEVAHLKLITRCLKRDIIPEEKLGAWDLQSLLDATSVVVRMQLTGKTFPKELRQLADAWTEIPSNRLTTLTSCFRTLPSATATQLALSLAGDKDDPLDVFNKVPSLSQEARTKRPRQTPLSRFSCLPAGTWNAFIGDEMWVKRLIARPLLEGLHAYGQGQHQLAIQLLLPLRYNLQFLGGSESDRDVFQQILTDACFRAGELKLARAMLSERIARRPNSPISWAQRGDVHEAMEEHHMADDDRRRGFLIGLHQGGTGSN